MVIFHSYANLPEGIYDYIILYTPFINYGPMVLYLWLYYGYIKKIYSPVSNVASWPRAAGRSASFWRGNHRQNFRPKPVRTLEIMGFYRGIIPLNGLKIQRAWAGKGKMSGLKIQVSEI